jgi:uncharacterized membrane protein HdeD (DUF308 family)
MNAPTDLPDNLPPEIRQNPRFLLGLGVALIVLGLAAVAVPLVAQLIFVAFLAAILILVGAGKVFHALKQPSGGAIVLGLAVSAAYLVSGLLMLIYPLSGFVALTILLAVFLVVKGGLKTAAAWHQRPQAAWGWNMASGLLSVLLGLLIWFGLPGTALWAIGLLIGIDLLFSGLTMIAFTAPSRAAEAEPPSGVGPAPSGSG